MRRVGFCVALIFSCSIGMASTKMSAGVVRFLNDHLKPFDRYQAIDLGTKEVFAQYYFHDQKKKLLLINRTRKSVQLLVPGTEESTIDSLTSTLPNDPATHADVADSRVLLKPFEVAIITFAQ